MSKISIADAEDAMLEAKAELEEALIEAISEWYMPLLQMQLGLLSGTLPEDVKAMIDPAGLEAIDLLMKGR